VEAAGGNMTLLNLNGFGPELNVVHPPRPQDPKVDWNQEYVVKLRLRSYTSSIAGMPGMPSGGSRGTVQRPSRNQAPSQVPSQESAPSESQGSTSTTPAGGAPIPDITNAVEGGVKLLKGLFGR
jgi:hypothetical protein